MHLLSLVRLQIVADSYSVAPATAHSDTYTPGNHCQCDLAGVPPCCLQLVAQPVLHAESQLDAPCACAYHYYAEVRACGSGAHSLHYRVPACAEAVDRLHRGHVREGRGCLVLRQKLRRGANVYA